MQIQLYWIDKNWQKRGSEAKNEHLYVDYAQGAYKYSVDCYGVDNSAKNVEVVRKSDLKDYMKALEQNGFRKVN